MTYSMSVLLIVPWYDIIQTINSYTAEATTVVWTALASAASVITRFVLYTTVSFCTILSWVFATVAHVCDCIFHSKLVFLSVNYWCCWLGSRSLKKLSGEVLAWLSVWNKVQMICIWSSWCRCHTIISSFIRIRNDLPFWCQLTQVIPAKRPLNGCTRCHKK